MLLIYTPDTDRYEGTRLAVPIGLFEAAVAELVAGGMPDSEARAQLSDAATWSADLAGMELLSAHPLCLHCRRRRAPDRSPCCDVRSEASFSAETHGA
jgi:hypothetical protein